MTFSRRIGALSLVLAFQFQNSAFAFGVATPQLGRQRRVASQLPAPVARGPAIRRLWVPSGGEPGVACCATERRLG